MTGYFLPPTVFTARESWMAHSSGRLNTLHGHHAAGAPHSEGAQYALGHNAAELKCAAWAEAVLYL